MLLSSAFACADDKKVLIVKSMSVPVIDEHVALFEKNLEREAAKHGVRYTTTIVNAGGSREAVSSFLAKTIEEDRPDLIVSSATLATQEVFEFLKKYPADGRAQVYFTVTDPWGAGVVDGTAPISGVPYYLPSDIKINIAQRLTRPDAGGHLTIGFVHSSYPSSVSDLERVRTAAADAGVGLVPLAIEYRAVGEHLEAMLSDVKKMASRLDKNVDYWWIAKGPLGERPETVAALKTVSDKPVLYGNSHAAVENGAIFYASVNNQESMQIAADLALNFLQLKPHDPSTQAVMGQSYELFFNLAAADTAGIVIPSDLLDVAIKNSGVVGKMPLYNPK